ncbi:MAG TPA: DUF6056 family protein [Thermoanaerobaculia bacterium]
MGERGRSARTIIAIGFSAFVLLAWFARAWSWRWIADDYCFATMAWRDGFWRGQGLMYARLNGRISVSFLMAVITSLGRFTTPALAFLVMAVWLSGARTSVRYAFALVDARVSRLEELAGALVFVAVIISVAPDSDQPLIWLLGLVTYGVPIVCATWMAALILRQAASGGQAPPPVRTGEGAWPPPLLAAVAVLAFVAGGCSEVAAAAQVIFLTMLAPFAKRVRPLLIAAALASAAALLIECLSGGNAIRRALFEPLPIPAAAVKAIADTPLMLSTLMMQGIAPFLLLIVFFAFASDGPKRPSRALAISALLSTLPITAMTLFGGLYGTGHLPWARVQFVPVAYTTAALVFATLAVPLPGRASVALAFTLAVALLIGVDVLSTSAAHVQTIRDARQFALTADQIDDAARHGRGAALVVRAPREYQLLEFVSPDPDHWTNRCMANYYGLTSIRTPLPYSR